MGRVLVAAALGLLPAMVVASALSLGMRGWWGAILGYHIVCILVPAIALLRRPLSSLSHWKGFGGQARLRASDAGVARLDLRRWILPAAALSIVLVAGPWIGGVWAYRQGLLPAATRALLLQVEPWALFVVWSIALNPFMEEYYWRGFLLPLTGVPAGAAFFGFMHFAGFAMVLPPLQALLLCLPATAAGVFWGWMRRRFDNLWPCIATHLAADIGILIVFCIIRAGQ